MELTADELVAKAKRMSAEVAAFRVQLVTMEEAAGAAHAERVHTAQAADAARQAAKALRLAAAEATRAAKATAALVTIRDAEVAAAVATLVALEEATAAAARAEEESAAKVVTEGQQVDLAAPAGPWQPVDAGRSRELGARDPVGGLEPPGLGSSSLDLRVPAGRAGKPGGRLSAAAAAAAVRTDECELGNAKHGGCAS